ncbi:hypothetical protein NE237_026828 [Protea cynaroides]|uniref:Uncharacterized protein n=1 Tax=Protea cynaroides TaxID=273540 RepID=A0A9Q0JSF6_9MAGN|nr:hypothetical protein NE237_026828 [Protea cynaroides]
MKKLQCSILFLKDNILSFAQNLTLMIANETDFLSEVLDAARSLCNEVNLMSSALGDASEKRRTRNEVKEWLNQVRDAVMEAEDVIDFFLLEGERQRHRNFLTRYMISYPKHLYIHNLRRKIENSNKRIDQLSARRSTLGLATSETGQNSVGMITNEQGLHFRGGDEAEEFYVIRFQKEENVIVQKLLTPIESPKPCPTVVSIVGMGGGGKTTLVRKVYKRNEVKQHFQTRVWISVSQQDNIRDLLHEKKELNVEILIHRLSSQSKETTYLIVFDDLWSPEDWHKLKKALPIQGEGYQSRVLVTTRNEAVDRHANPNTDPYFLRLLNEYECWELFLTKVMDCPKDLEDLERKIVHKCHRLPLAIVVLGGLLSLKPKTHIAWSKVVDSVHWELNKNESSWQQVLALSYADLPDHLKLDVAEDYMEELIQRSMIQATSRGYDGRENKGMMPLSGAMKLLRVLDLQNVDVEHIPSSLQKQIGKLVLLKYLNLRGWLGGKELPFSVGDLQNLQTLDLRDIGYLQFPRAIVKLQQLRNLVFSGSCSFPEISENFDHMKQLQTLVLREGKWIEGRLDRLTNLRVLCIQVIKSISPYKEALLSVLPKLNHLRGFGMIYQYYEGSIIHMVLERITRIQDFPSNLTTLTLRGILNAGDLMESLKELTKLRRLILDDIRRGLEINFSADGFRELEELQLLRIDNLELTVEKGALTYLRVLMIDATKLQWLPLALKHMVALQELALSYKSKKLINRVQKDAGEDWEIIKHIPSVVVFDSYIYIEAHSRYEYGEWFWYSDSLDSFL